MPKRFRMQWKALSAAAVLLCGCAVRKPSAGQVVVNRDCMVSIELTDKTKCTAGKDGTLVCEHLKLTYLPGCPKVEIKKRR